MIKYVGFDKDGTLIDSNEAITKAWGKIINDDFGIDPKDAEKVFGQTALGQQTQIQLALTLKEHNVDFPKDKLFEKANEIAIRMGQNAKADPFPEVLGILGKLKEEGYFIFVSSGHQESVVKDDLERTGLIKYVDYYAGVRPDQPEFRKGESHFKAVAKHFEIDFAEFIKETVFVGDTPEDISVAKDSGIISITRIGTLPKEKLLELGAKFVIPDLLSLPEIIKSL
jgi:phosphoglycolate phosphatase-like HAD superfamily hydrolase